MHMSCMLVVTMANSLHAPITRQTSTLDKLAQGHARCVAAAGNNDDWRREGEATTCCRGSYDSLKSAMHPFTAC